MSDKKNMLNGSDAVKMEINSKPATNSCDFSQCSSSGTTVAQETGNLKLRSKICDCNWVRDWETETEADIISASFASFVSLVRMLILNCEFCFDSYAASASLLFWNFAHLPLRQVQVHRIRETKRATSSQCTHLFCVNRLFPSVGPEVFMSFVTNRQGSQITDFGKLLQGGWLMRNEKPSEKKTREYYLQNVFLFARERERHEQVSRFGKFAWPEVVAPFVHLPWVKGDADDLFEIVSNNRNYNWMSTSNEFPSDLWEFQV